MLAHLHCKYTNTSTQEASGQGENLVRTYTDKWTRTHTHAYTHKNTHTRTHLGA